MKKALKNALLIQFLIAVVFANTTIAADQCPIPPTSISPVVSVKIDYDRKSRLYTYSYTVENGRTAKVPIIYFALKLHETPYSSAAPSAQWIAEFFEASEDLPARFGWQRILESI